MIIEDRKSPNFDSRPADRPVDILLLHYTGMEDAAGALDRLCDPQAKVSAHYLIDEDGSVYRLVDEALRAWHAGVSSWAGIDDINGCSIGVELVNPGHEFGYRPYPAVQMNALARLASDILARHPIPACNVIGHSDIAPDRKQDPGELFDWRWLSGQGAGLWPEDDMLGGDAGGEKGRTETVDIAMLLSSYGYKASTAEEVAAATLAFQRHFQPSRLGKPADAETLQLLRWLVAARRRALAHP